MIISKEAREVISSLAGGGYGICCWISRGVCCHNPQSVSSGLRASYGWMGKCGVEAWALWGSGSSLSSRATSAVWGAQGISTGLRLCHMLYWEELPNHSTQPCSTLGSATVCSLLTSWTSMVNWNLHSGMTFHHTRLFMQGGTFQQPTLSSLAAGNVKPAAVFWLVPVPGHHWVVLGWGTKAPATSLEACLS